MSAALSTEVRGLHTSGRPGRFKAFGRGLYGLRRSSAAVHGSIEEQNASVKTRLRDALGSMHPRAFEELIAQLLTAIGFEDVEVTSYSRDGGVDVRGRLAVGGVTDVRTAIQVKRWGKNVPDHVVRELRGGLGTHERGLIITLSDFTPASKIEAVKSDRAPISLVSGDELVNLLVEYRIGVVARDVTVLELDEGAIGLNSEQEDVAAVEAPGASIVGDLGGRGVWIWPLPGGRKGWLRSLQRMLREVVESDPTVSSAVEWMIKSFANVQSEGAARSYWNVPRRMGLIEVLGERLQLTEAGATYLSTGDDAVLLGQIEATIAGISELLEALREAPLDESQALEVLRSKLGVTWQTTAQVKHRLGWLENLGVVRRRGKAYGLVTP